MGALRNWLTAAATCLALGMASSLPAQALLSENFEAGSSLEGLGFTTVDVGGTPETPFPPTWELAEPGDTVRDNSRVAFIYYDVNNSLDDYLITPAMELESGKTYEISYRVNGGGNSVVDEMDVYLFEGPIPAPENVIDILILGELIRTYDFFEGTELSAATTPRNEAFTITPSSTGTYHIAFYARSFADQYFISIDDLLVYNPSGAPLPTDPLFPAPGATNINQNTYVEFAANPSATSHTVYFSANQADVAAGTAPKILDNASDVFYADPGNLAYGTTYYVRVDATNANGTTEGDVYSFTTRQAPVAGGHVYWADNFDERYLHPRSGAPVNAGYPALPKGWESIDLDGLTNREGFVSAFYVETDGTATRQLSQPSALRSRGSGDGASNDWVFLPPIQTHATLNTIVRLWARGGAADIVETASVRYSTNAASINPADYTNVLGTIETDPVSYDPFIPYDYVLPKGQTVRVAINCTSDLGSRFIIDDVSVFLGEPAPSLAVLSPANGAVDVNLDTWVVSPTALSLTGLELFFGTNQTDVANGALAPLDPVVEGGWYFDPGTLQPNTTYYAMLRTTNESGSNNGPVSSFTTRAAVGVSGGTFFFENFDAHPYAIPSTTVNAGYPYLPKGWDAFDGDGSPTLAGGARPFYIDTTGAASFKLSQPASLWSRGRSDSGQNDDWIFLPPVDTHATMDTIVRIWARGGFADISEIGEVRTSTVTNSVNPADYTNLLGTIETDPVNVTLYEPWEFVLPKGQSVRVAINSKTVGGSRFILDDISLFVPSTPDPQTIVFPANGATDVNQVTYLYLPNDDETDSYTVYFGANQADVANKTVAPILTNSTDVFFADPGNLAPNTTYYVMLVATNSFGDTNGPVTSFTTRAAATGSGGVYWAENFDAPHFHPRSGADVNVGYPELPKGWDSFDGDGLTTRAGIQTGFYVENLGTASFNRSQPAALWSRGVADAASNDWIFLPRVDTHATLDTVLRVWARGGSNNINEFANVVYSTNPVSNNPAEYTNSLGEIDISQAPYLDYQSYDFVLPKGQSVRVALNCTSFSGSRFITDDFSIFIAQPPPALSLARPVNGAAGVAVNEYLYLQKHADVLSRTVYFSAVESEVADMTIAPIASNVSGTNYVDPGTLLPGTTYYVRVVSNNDSGSTAGPVTSFTTLPVPTQVGDQFFWESFEGPHAATGEANEEGYPAIPKGWDLLDVDGKESGWADAPDSWVVFNNTTRTRTGANALVAFFNNDMSPNDDWVFLPQVQTPADKETSVRFWSRVRSGDFPETIEVYVSTTGTNSTDPQDYTLIDTLDGITNLTYAENVFALPANASARVALRYVSVDAWYPLIDDVEIFISGDAPSGTPGDFNNDGVVNVADVTALANFHNGNGSVTGDPDFDGSGDFDEADIAALAEFVVNQ